MRVLLWTDMEGMSRVTDHRQCWPVFPEYWETGRRAFTDETVAAARGLLEGGATEVFVVNGHGLGWPNLLVDELPDGSRLPDARAWSAGFDAMFQVGFHARVGTRDGFMSHTLVPGLTVLVDGTAVTESQIWAWLHGVEVLGVAGDAALEAQLDPGLAGTPFLPVKHSTARTNTQPAHRDPADSARAISEFARRCVHERTGTLPSIPERFTLQVSMDPALVPHAEGRHGLRRTSEDTLSLEATDWGRDAYPALQDAMDAALVPMRAAGEGELDLSTEAAMRAQDDEALERLRAFFVAWADSRTD
jgi:D-amino peptidase